MTATKGLSDNQRTVLGIIFGGIVAINVYMTTLPEEQRPPQMVFVVLGGIIVLVTIVKDQLGIRDASVSAVSKKTDPTYPTFRKTEPNT
jgi:hypothetical protein